MSRANLQLKVAEPDQAVPWIDDGLVHARLPVMLAYIEKNERCTYHNEAFRRGLGLSAEQIDGRALRAVLGESRYAAVSARICEALAGRVVHENAAHAHVHLVPHFDAEGAVAGLYALVIDESQCCPDRLSTSGAPRLPPASNRVPLEPADPCQGVDALYEGHGDDDEERRDAATRLRAAIQAGQFRLYSQSIKPLSTGDGSLQGIFVRQAEEEESRLPPGMFLSLTQEFGLQGELDRWVISKLLAHEAAQRRSGTHTPSVYCVSLSHDSIGDPFFPEFLSSELQRTGIAAQVLCFEIQEADVKKLRADSAELVRQLRDMGARVMLAGFGRDNCLELLKGMRVDFLKIDGSIIFNVGRSEWALGRVRAIVRVAQVVGISTVAELVESEDIASTLRDLAVDYAQGMSVSAALPLGDFEI